MCGISVSYGLGRALGSLVVRRFGRRLHLNDEKMSRVCAWSDCTGRLNLLVGYFIPGVRHLAGLLAGASKPRFRDFALFAYSGAIACSICLVAVGYFSGKDWSRRAGRFTAIS